MEILLRSSIEDDKIFAREAACAAGMGFSIAADADEVLARISSSDETFLLLFGLADIRETEEFHEKIAPRIGSGPGMIHPDLVHMIGILQPEEVTEYFKKSLFGCFLLRNFGNPSEAAQHYGGLLPEILAKRGVVGPERRPSEHCETIRLRHSLDKADAINKISDFLINQAHFQERMVNTICAAVDELIMNAIYDAPMNSDGQQKFKGIPRTTPVALDGRQELEIFAAMHGEYVSVSVTDNFGSLKRANIIKHVLKNYRSKDYKVDESIFNGGIGLATTFQMGGSLLFFCDTDSRTEAMVLFRKTDNFKQFKAQFRFVAVQADG